MENTVIHRLDLLDYTQGTAEQKKNFSDAIGRAFNETGFVTIRNHGLNNALIQSLYQEVKALFDLPGNAIEALTPSNYVFAGTNMNFLPIYGTITQVDDLGALVWSKRYSDASIGFQINPGG